MYFYSVQLLYPVFRVSRCSWTVLFVQSSSSLPLFISLKTLLPLQYPHQSVIAFQNTSTIPVPSPVCHRFSKHFYNSSSLTSLSSLFKTLLPFQFPHQSIITFTSVAEYHVYTVRFILSILHCLFPDTLFYFVCIRRFLINYFIQCNKVCCQSCICEVTLRR